MTTLADLRKASLKEQREEADQSDVLPAGGTAAEEANVQLPSPQPPPAAPSADTEIRTHVRKSVSTQARAQVRTYGRTEGREKEGKKLRADAPVAEPLGDRVRTALAQKVVHPGGVKATVDMSPELSLRAKRYCLEHGNVPVRQLFLELMTAFLDEEGY
jgi:hypothetical protein